jgi:hypothetical protein
MADKIQDGYDETEMAAAAQFCWQAHRKQLMEPFLRTVVDFLLAHNTLPHSEACLSSELPDFLTIPLLDESPTSCFR